MQREKESALFITKCLALGVVPEQIRLGATLGQLRNHLILLCLEISEGYQWKLHILGIHSVSGNLRQLVTPLSICWAERKEMKTNVEWKKGKKGKNEDRKKERELGRNGGRERERKRERKRILILIFVESKRDVFAQFLGDAWIKLNMFLKPWDPFFLVLMLHSTITHLIGISIPGLIYYASWCRLYNCAYSWAQSWPYFWYDWQSKVPTKE